MISMFNPNHQQVRLFFCNVYSKLTAQQQNHTISPIERITWSWIEAHPEYHGYLADKEMISHWNFSIENGQTNPFLHLSMHLALTEQIATDQPKGITDIFRTLLNAHIDEHEAQHILMDALGRLLWEQQRALDLNSKDSLELMSEINEKYLRYLHIATEKALVKK